MNKSIKYDRLRDEFIIQLVVPKTMRGKYTLDEMNDVEDSDTWEQDAVCVFIRDSHCEYSLNHTQYLDYKDSLQATQTIIYFDSREEALRFAKRYNLMVEYSR